MTTTSYHLCQDLQGALNNWSDRKWRGVAKENGKVLSPAQVKAIKKFYEVFGHIDVLIGFAKGEEGRATKSLKLQEFEKQKTGSWGHVLNRVFPLIELDLDRAACVAHIESRLGYEVMPSNCMICPYQSLPELLWLSRNYPQMWTTWVNIEKRKIDRDEHRHGMVFKDKNGNDKVFKNNGVCGSRKFLPEKLLEAKSKFGHLADIELRQMKKFHGCTKNAF